MAERFAFVTEEEINLLVDRAVPENTKKSTSYAVNVFDGKLFVNRIHISATCIHTIKKVCFPFTDMLYFFPKHILLTEAKCVRNSGNEY